MQPPQQYQARLEERIEHNPKYLELHFELAAPHQIQFEAGQYVSIKCSEQGHRRSYSICNRPDITHGFELLVDVTPQGVGTKYLSELQPGQEVHILGPLGQFTIANNPQEQQLVFIATGSGITPFKSMILDLLQVKQDKRPMTLYWGMRHAEQLFWMDEWLEIQQSFPNFKLHPVISRPMPEWTLCRGHVTDCLNVHQFHENAGFYLCGNQAMIEETTTFLQDKHVPPDRIHFEKFF
ncbi:MAG TPA: FAD-binding oxidoreductase [Patescibacteria group bacterium]